MQHRHHQRYLCYSSSTSVTLLVRDYYNCWCTPRARSTPPHPTTHAPTTPPHLHLELAARSCGHVAPLGACRIVCTVDPLKAALVLDAALEVGPDEAALTLQLPGIMGAGRESPATKRSSSLTGCCSNDLNTLSMRCMASSAETLGEGGEHLVSEVHGKLG